MKRFNKREEDCYVFMEDGVMKEEIKDAEKIKIMQNDKRFDDIDSNEQEEPKTKELYENLSDKFSSMPKRSIFNRILVVAITIVSILLLINIVGLFKAVQQESSNQFSVDVKNIKINNKSRKELFFLTDVIQNSNTKIKNYYDTINSNILNSTGSTSSVISNIEKNIDTDLKDVEKLKQMIDKKDFKQPISILEDRFNNLKTLTRNLLTTQNFKNINLYNQHAQEDISLLNNLTAYIRGYFEYFKVEYSMKDDSTFIYIKK